MFNVRRMKRIDVKAYRKLGHENLWAPRSHPRFKRGHPANLTFFMRGQCDKAMFPKNCLFQNTDKQGLLKSLLSEGRIPSMHYHKDLKFFFIKIILNQFMRNYLEYHPFIRNGKLKWRKKRTFNKEG